MNKSDAFTPRRVGQATIAIQARENYKRGIELDTVVHTYNPGTWEAGKLQ